MGDFNSFPLFKDNLTQSCYLSVIYVIVFLEAAPQLSNKPLLGEFGIKH